VLAAHRQVGAYQAHRGIEGEVLEHMGEQQ
jgi:hypothetical protein